MADASLVVRVSAVGERKLKQIRRDLDRISVSATAASASLKAFGTSYTTQMNRRLDEMSKSYKRHFDELDSMVKATGRLLSKGLSLAIKATTAEFGLMGLSMITVHGLFAAGNLLAKAYTGTMNVLAGAAASAAVALASVAAAMRENNAAMFAYKADGSYRQFGNNLNQVRVVMRGMERDTRLATLTVENLNAAYAAVSSRSTFTRGSQTLLRGLMDFASAGQPLDQGVKAAGDLIGVLQDPKASFGEISKAAEALGPSMKKAMEEAKKEGINTAEELRRAINDGTLAAMGGVEGQFDAVNSTLLSVMRGGFNQIRSMFADLGQPFLKPLKEATDEIINIFRRTFMRTYGSLQKFGTGTFIDGLVGAVEKLNDLFVHLVREYLPNVKGMMDRIRDRWDDFSRGWNRLIEGLRPLREGAKVLLEFLGKIFGPIWDRITDKFGAFNRQLQSNQSNLNEFGTALGEMLVSFSRITDTIRDLFFQSLPFLTKLANGIRQVAELLGNVLENLGNLFGGAGGGFGAFGVLMGIGVIGRQMQQTKGGFVQRSVGNMNVNAGTVVVTGATAGGQMYPGAAGAQGMTGMPGGYVPHLRGGGAGMSSQRQIVNAANIAANQGAPLTAAQGAQMGLTPSQITQANTRAAAKSGGRFRNGQAGPGPLQRLSATHLLGPRRLRSEGATGRAYQTMMRMNRTGTARMGAMAGLGLASQFMPEETQGAMALGSAIGAYNPLIGLGVAGLGTALTSQNATIGIGGGAAGGAALGSMIAPGFGTAAGAIIGAAIGGIKAGINANNARKDEARAVAKDASEQLLEAMSEGIREASKEGNIEKFYAENIKKLAKTDALTQLAIDSVAFQKDEGDKTHKQRQELVDYIYRNRKELGIEMSHDQYRDARDKPHEFLEELEGQAGYLARANATVTDHYIDNLELLTSALNMTEDEVIRLAQSTGTNLFDALQSTDEMITSMVKGLVFMREQYEYAILDVAAGAFDSLRTIREREQAPAVMDEAAQNLLDLNREGALTGADVATGFEDIYRGLLAYFEGDVELATANFIDQFGPSGIAFQSGNTLSGLDAEGQALLQSIGAEFIPQMTAGAAAAALEGIQARYLSIGRETDLSQDAVQNLLMTNPQAFLGFSESMFGMSDEDLAGGALTRLLTETFPNFDFSVTQVEDKTKNLEGAAQAFIDALNLMSDELNLAIQQLNDPGDTRTPRGDTLSSRFSRTMTAHSQFDSMLTGKRTITSGWRNFNLGSPSSDHVMGRAYDLTGQNLGQYKSLIDASGGFAEFHGSGGSRHLHVVPNTSGAVGDASSPVGSMMTGAAGSTSYNNYTINVNGADHSPQEIADMVMVELDRLAISDGERR